MPEIIAWECFNPCCIGLAIAARLEPEEWLPQREFQSLLYWISHCGAVRHYEAQLAQVFQSLLYWISHCGIHRAVARRAFFLSFNPCCIGLAIAAPPPYRSPDARISVSILVVLD